MTDNKETVTGIIGAIKDEVASLEAALTDKRSTFTAGMEFCEGRLDGARVVVVKCGMGKVNAAVCAGIVIREFRACRVINTGVAGSLDASIDIGDIVVSTDAVQHDFDLTPIGCEPGEFPDLGAKAFTADADMRRRAVAAVKASAPDINVFEGRVCTGDQFIASKEKRGAIVSVFGGLCCEMEGGAIAQVCSMNKTPFVIIRAISDKAGDSGGMSYLEFEKAAAARCASTVRYMIARL